MRKAAVVAGASIAAAAAGSAILYSILSKKPEETQSAPDASMDIEHTHFQEVTSLTELDAKIYELAQKYDHEARELLKDLIRIPAYSYYADKLCGTSNHEGPRLELLKRRIVELKAVANPSDVFFDEFGSLCWSVTDPDDPTPADLKKVIYLDGHSDTVNPLRDEWQDRIGKGIDCYNGVTDPDRVDFQALQRELKYVPAKDKWASSIIFGRGSADQLQGVVSQVFATKILLETRNLGSLRGAFVYSVATVAEEDNDGGAPMHILRKQANIHVPDCVVITEGTGDLDKGPCGIYIGQRGRCQVEVEVIGRSCHGSMPYMGLNPLEYGSAIIAEAAEKAKDGFKPNKFLGCGTRTASMCHLETPSDCAVPARYTFRFDRRMTAGEDSRMAVREIEGMNSVAAARAAGLTVHVRIPRYTEPSWKGVKADNDQSYMGWVTPASNPVVLAAVEAYKRCVSPHVEDVPSPGPDNLRKKPRVERWIFSTDGVGYPVKKGEERFDVSRKGWLQNGNFIHPPMFGIGAGYEHHCHKLGEYLHADHLWVPISVIARFPSLFVQKRSEAQR